MKKREIFSKFGLRRGQPPLLFLLFERDGRTVSEISKGFGISPATISKMVTRMEVSGLVSKKHDSSDMRISGVYLTEKSTRLKDKLEKTILETGRDAFSVFHLKSADFLKAF